MEGAAKTGDAWNKTKAEYVEKLNILYPHIKPSDMKTIVTSIFALLKVTENVEAQHTKKRPARKRSEKQKENQHEKNEKKKAERLQREEQARQGKPAGESPQKAAQQKQKRPAGYAETEEDVAFV
jgi:hypothetical protein